MEELQAKLAHATNTWAELNNKVKEFEDFLLHAKQQTKEFWQLDGELKSIINTLNERIDRLHEVVDQKEVIINRQALKRIEEEELPDIKEKFNRLNIVSQGLIKCCTEEHCQKIQFVVDEITTLLDDTEQRLKQGINDLEEIEKITQNFLNAYNTIEQIVEEYESKMMNCNYVKSATVTALYKEIDYYKTLTKKLRKRQRDIDIINPIASHLAHRYPQIYEKLQGSEIIKEMHCRWEVVIDRTKNQLERLEVILTKLLHIEKLLNDTNLWIQQYEESVGEFKFDASDKEKVKSQVSQLQAIHKEISSKESVINAITSTAEEIGQVCPNKELLDNVNYEVDEINRQWHALLEKAAYQQSQLLDCFLTSQELENTVKEFTHWLSRVETYFNTKHHVAALPSSAEFHLDEFKVFVEEEIPLRKKQLENIKSVSREFATRTETTTASLIEDLVNELMTSWTMMTTKMTARQQQLSEELDQAQRYQEQMQELDSWLELAESKMDAWDYVSTNKDVLNRQLEEQKAFNKALDEKQKELNEISSQAQILFFGKSTDNDAKSIKTTLRVLNQRWNKLSSGSLDREQQINQSLESASSFFNECADMLNWSKEANYYLQEIKEVGIDIKVIQEQIKKHKEFQNQLGERRSLVYSIISKGKLLRHSSQPKDITLISEYLADLKLQWKRVCNKSLSWQEELEDALLASGKLTATMSTLLEWLMKIKPELGEDMACNGDIDTVKELLDNHKILQRDLGSRTKIKSKISMSAKYLTKDQENNGINDDLNKLNETWDLVCDLSVQRQEKLQKALSLAQEFHIRTKDIVRNLGSADKRLKDSIATVEESQDLNRLSAKLKGFEQELETLRHSYDSVMTLGQTIVDDCHHNAIGSMRHWLTIIKKLWNNANEKLNRYNIKLDELSNEAQNDEKMLVDIENWISESTNRMKEPIEEIFDLATVEKMLEEHKAFENIMRNKFSVIRNITSSLNMIQRSSSLITLIPNAAKTVNNVNSNNNVASTRLQEINNGWDRLEVLVEERKIRLQELQQELVMKRIKRTFEWDTWRKALMRRFNDKISSVTEFVQSISSENKIQRGKFVKVFINSGFNTTETEMECVANRFDRNGFVDSREFISSLRPSAFKHPKTDAEKIDVEILRMVSDCKCLKPFRVSRAGEGKYRFGESQKLRLVRILRSSIMVRVGGGWEELSVFLNKNDPCRSETKAELREKFVLAEGVSQKMQSFKSSMKSNKGQASKFRRYIYAHAVSDDELSDDGSDITNSTVRTEFNHQTNPSEDTRSVRSYGSDHSRTSSQKSIPLSVDSGKRSVDSKKSKIPSFNKKTRLPKLVNNSHN